MKRFLSILLVAMLVVTCLATVAFATESEATVSVSSVKADRGDKVTVTYTVKGEFANFELFVKAGDGLKLVAIDGPVEANVIAGSAKFGKVAFAKSENVDSACFTATFEVSRLAACGKLNVTADVIFIANRDLVKLPYSVDAGAVTVDHEIGNTPLSEFHVPATCDTKGQEGYPCNFCDFVKIVAVDPLGHDYKLVDSKPATCTDDGYESYVCSRDASHKYTNPIPALGHNYVGTVTKEPDCVNPGEMTYVCQNDPTHTYTEVIDPLGHVWCEDFECEHDHEHYDDSYHWYLCLVCGEKKDVEKHVYGEEINGYKFCKCGHWIEVEDPGKDPEPDNGDNTLELAMGFTAIVAMMAAAAYVCKRKFAK